MFKRFRNLLAERLDRSGKKQHATQPGFELMSAAFDKLEEDVREIHTANNEDVKAIALLISVQDDTGHYESIHLSGASKSLAIAAGMMVGELIAQNPELIPIIDEATNRRVNSALKNRSTH